MSRSNPSPALIVSPALADANNGNWQTARRWARWLRAAGYTVQVVREVSQAQCQRASLLIALHARRSAGAIDRWVSERGSHRLAVVLTGTDLYGAGVNDPVVAKSLELASHIVVLQEPALNRLPIEHRHKSRVILQSTSSRKPLPHSAATLRVVVAGHLRAEKDPETLWRACHRLAGSRGLRIDHFGSALEPHWAEQAQATMRDCPFYRWHGGVPHDTVRRYLQRADLLVHMSRVEGGAHVIMEAVCSGAAVLASRIEGNVGMLGTDYPGYFESGDDAALAVQLKQLLAEHEAGGRTLETWRAAAIARAEAFRPARECQAVQQLAADLIRA